MNKVSFSKYFFLEFIQGRAIPVALSVITINVRKPNEGDRSQKSWGWEQLGGNWCVCVFGQAQGEKKVGKVGDASGLFKFETRVRGFSVSGKQNCFFERLSEQWEM